MVAVTTGTLASYRGQNLLSPTTPRSPVPVTGVTHVT